MYGGTLRTLAISGYGRKISSMLAACMLIIAGFTLIIPPGIALAAVDISASSTKLYGPSLVRILITDTSKHAVTDTINPHIEVKRGTTILASADPSISIIGTSGSFEFFLTTSNAPKNPTNPTYYTNAFVGRINNSPVGDANDFLLTLPGTTHLQNGDTIQVYYRGMTENIQFKKSQAIILIDRSTAGQGDYIRVTLVDGDANTDPTKIDVYSATSSVVTASTGILDLSGAKFRENGQNSGQFDLMVAVDPASPVDGASLTGVMLPDAVTFTIYNKDVYKAIPGATAPFDAISPKKSTSNSSTSVNLANSDAFIALTSPISLPNGITLQVNDPDVTITYSDVAPSTYSNSYIVTKVVHSQGSISASPSSLSVHNATQLTIIDSDLNLDNDFVDSFVVAFPAGANTGTPATFVQGAGGMTLDAKGSSITMASRLSMVFTETGPGTGIFTSSNIKMSKINASALGGLHAGDLVRFTYHDNLENPLISGTPNTSTVTLEILG